MNVYYFDALKASEDIASELGESEGMFLVNSETSIRLLGCWASNDANWRGEYFDGFMQELGFEVTDLPEEFHAQAVDLMMKAGIA